MPATDSRKVHKTGGRSQHIPQGLEPSVHPAFTTALSQSEAHHVLFSARCCGASRRPTPDQSGRLFRLHALPAPVGGGC